jgi:hypothetical protein
MMLCLNALQIRWKSFLIVDKFGVLSSVPCVPTLTLFTKEDCSLCDEALGKHSTHQSPNF